MISPFWASERRKEIIMNTRYKLSPEHRENIKKHVTIKRLSHGNVYDLRGISLTLWGYDTPEEEMDAFVDYLEELAASNAVA